MPGDDPVSESRDLLRRLAAHDEASLRAVLSLATVGAGPARRSAPALDAATGRLVHLAALLVVGASSESLRWATDLAGSSGADDRAVAAVLVTTGSVAGSAQLVAAAAPLARALDLEPAVPPPLTDRADRRPTPAPPPPISRPPQACGRRRGPVS